VMRAKVVTVMRCYVHIAQDEVNQEDSEQNELYQFNSHRRMQHCRNRIPYDTSQ